MTALLEMFRLLIALVVSGVFALFGVTLESKNDQAERPEVRRTAPQIGSAAQFGSAAGPTASDPAPRTVPYRSGL